MQQMEEARLATLPPAKQAVAFNAAGTRFYSRGLVLEAEREFQAALSAESNNAEALAGLALVQERDGDTQQARLRAEASLKAQPNVTAYLVLARLDLQEDHKPDAATAVSNALKLEPQNAAARTLRQQIESKGQPVP